MDKDFKIQIEEYGKLLSLLAQFKQSISEHLTDEKQKKHYQNKAKEVTLAAKKIEEAKTDDELYKALEHASNI